MADYTISKIKLPNGDICNIKDTDTKNTAGSTNSTSKLFLIGATNQDTNPITYSNTNVFITDGMLSAKAIGINYGTDTNKVTMQWNDTDQSLDFIFA